MTARLRAAALLLGALLAGLVLVLGAAPASAAPLPGTTTTPIAPVRPVTGTESVAPATDGAPAKKAAPKDGTPKDGTPKKRAGVDRGPAADSALADPLKVVLLLGSLSFLPAVLIMTTAFTRIVIVLGFTRSALGTQGVPPNQVLIGLAMFLTMFVMAPVFGQMNEQAVKPYLNKEIEYVEAYERGIEPLREFMLEQVRDKDLQLFVDLSGDAAPANADDVPTTTLVPAFLISELRAAFLIGFVVFIPFVVIDLVVSAALSAMGMAMLPPSLISLPFKLLLFVAVDGWYLLVSSLVRSFG